MKLQELKEKHREQRKLHRFKRKELSLMVDPALKSKDPSKLGSQLTLKDKFRNLSITFDQSEKILNSALKSSRTLAEKKQVTIEDDDGAASPKSPNKRGIADSQLL